MKNLKFSLITPEHSKKNAAGYLLELYDTIQSQSYQNWEWILYLNNGCATDDIPDIIKQNDKVKIFQDDNVASSVGACKRNAFFLGTGDILVEMDHDDLLTPDCLHELNNAFQDEAVGFVYSDNAVLHMKDEFLPYGENHGWKYDMFSWHGKQLYAMHSFEPSSHSLAYIWYAPDHVRAWTKDAYHQIGGHNSELDICDDHELMIRTYLHTEMKRIPKVLYLYRVSGENTWIERNEAIQLKTVELSRKYSQKLAERDADKRGLLKVDIGSGISPYPGYISVDLHESAHIKWDLNDGLPFGDNTVGVLNASHILEHLKDPVKSMREIHRVLAHGGWAFIEVPSTDGRGAFQDPTHVSFWNENSFLYYTNGGLAQYIGNRDIRFQEYRRETYYPNQWLQSINVLVTSAWLVAIKHDHPRYPGLLNI